MTISLVQKFTFPEGTHEETKQTFDSTNCTEARIGLPLNQEPVKPKGGDYNYSGMHDHGPLVEPKEGGDFALLVDVVQKAKEGSDALLTKIIEEEKKNAKGERINKKQKTDS